ncbi:hypothetical protein KTD33_07795 [Burkholderia gladioli]|uniref:hypothetical protein n=1 Tax=Burkholderia gladioli TaxID=28095 RepID=UPI001C2453F7|nr:hypothetical protein [Burkholderia gladioli]MBU9194438.1 hypothetical protein [Burkholderia gladioli]
MRKFDGVFRDGLTREPDTWIVEEFFDRPIAHFHDKNNSGRIVDTKYLEEKIEEAAVT